MVNVQDYDDYIEDVQVQETANAKAHLVLGFKAETYIGQECFGHNTNFVYKDAELQAYLVYVQSVTTGQVYCIRLSESFGESYSGWCTASWGEMGVSVCSEVPQDLTPTKSKTVIDLDVDENYEVYKCAAFTYSYDGGDSYYPGGGVSLNRELFDLPEPLDS